MPADLSSRGLLHRRELMLDEDALLDLENGFGSDRIRRILFERIQSVVTWTSLSAGRLALSISLLLVGFLFFVPFVRGDESPVNAVAFIFLPFGLISTIRNIVVRKCYLLIRMIDGTEHRVVSLDRPAKFQHFIRRLSNQIWAHQSAEMERRTLSARVG